MRLVFAALICALLTIESSAFAGERETVVLVAPTGDAFETRMRAELESMGFDVVVQGQLQGDPSGVLAVARILAGPPRRIEVVVVSTDPSLRVPTRSGVIDAPTTEDESVVSVRAAEQLRAFFQPLRPPTPPPALPPAEAPRSSPPVRLDVLPAAPGSPPPLIASSEPVAPKPDRERWMAGLAVGPAFDVGGPSLDAMTSLRLRLGDWAAIGGIVVVPLTANAVEATGGRADVWTGVLGADVGLALDLVDGRLLVLPSIGFGGAIVATSGAASAPYTQTDDGAVSAMPFGRLEIAPRIAGPVRLSAQGVLGVALPFVDVRFSGREVATWGLPWAGTALGASVGW